jgi:hypothetical protein
MPCLILGGIITVIFSQDMADFTNRFDPHKIGYNKKYFKILGIILIALASIIWMIFLIK